MGINIDPIRETRRFFSLANRETNLDERLLYARKLRVLGRPDLGLKVIESTPQTSEVRRALLLEKVLCLKDAGYKNEAFDVLAKLKTLFRSDYEINMLDFALKMSLDRQGVTRSTLDDVSMSIRSKQDLNAMIESLSWESVPIQWLPIILKTVASWAPSKCPSVLFKYIFALTRECFAKILIGFVDRILRLVTGKKEIVYSSMGKFTRLADLIDQVDSLFRKLTLEDKAKDTAVYIFFFGGYPNQTMLQMYGKLGTFLPMTGRVVKKIALFYIGLLKLAGRYAEITVDYRKISPYFLRGMPVINFSDQEAFRLESELNRIGIDPRKPFICMGLRDMAYYQFYGEVMKHPLSNQGKRSDTHHRCPPLEAYVEFAKYWASRGYQVVRMGLRVSDPLPSGLDPLIIDYASGERSDALDAFLFSRCWFLTAGDTGLFSGAAAFDRPSVVSDLFLIRNTIYSSNKRTRNIFVPKLIYDERADRFLKFSEQIHFNHYFSYSSECESAGLKIIHNSPEDIIDASLELIDRLSGCHQRSAEDIELQAAYHKIYLPDHIGYGSSGLISGKFLRKYSYLLD
jgi:putative glycosyltransferase (TIGR04372 family)